MYFKFGARAHDIGKGEPEEIFSKAHAIGLEYLQLVFKKALVDSSYNSEYVLRVKKALDDSKLKIGMLGAYFNPVHSDKEVVRKGKEEFKNNLDIAKTLNIDIVGSETGSYNDSPWTYVPKNHTEVGFQETLSVFKELKDYALSKGDCLSIEPAYGHVIYDVKCLKRFVEELDSNNIFVTIDLYNLIYIGNHEKHKEIFKEALECFKDRIRVVHLKDYIIKDEKVVQVAPGQGNFDYPYMLKMIKENCPEAVLVFEGVVEPDLTKSYSYLKGLAEQL